MGTLCFTVDFDRDCNSPIAGQLPAGSMSGGKVAPPRFLSSAEGAAILVEMLDGLGIPGTFFTEAETLSESPDVDLGGHEVALHGLAHEDLSESYDGMPLSESEIESLVREAARIVGDISGSRPLGFRAPYMKPPDRLDGVLYRLGFEYDSSHYSDMGGAIPPSRPGGIVRIPALKVPDGKGKTITSYLWPMHEGNREPGDYLALHEASKRGILVLATHTWHMVETCSGERMGAEEVAENLRRTAEVVEAALDAGFRAETCLMAARKLGKSPGGA